MLEHSDRVSRDAVPVDALRHYVQQSTFNACDALIIPNYSSFTFSAIALTRARKSPVFFRNEEGIEFREMSTFESFKDGNGGGDNDDDDNGQGSVPREESLETKIEK